MDRATERIERHIDRDREVLRSNLAELEDRVRAMVDWQQHYRNNPAAWMGIAFAGGLLIALAAAPRRAARQRLEYQRAAAPLAGYADHRQREISRAWRTIESALIGLAAAKLKQTLVRVLPGFREQLVRREGNGYAHEASASHRSQEH